MIRKIIQIDEEKCNGCGICADACHEGAIAMVNGKAKLMREDYCDGFGDCLPGCPTGAISFIEKDAPAYDEAAVKENMARKGKPVSVEVAGGTLTINSDEENLAANTWDESVDAEGGNNMKNVTDTELEQSSSEISEEQKEMMKKNGMFQKIMNKNDKQNKGQGAKKHGHGPGHGGCPGSRMAVFDRNKQDAPPAPEGMPPEGRPPFPPEKPMSQLRQWPCQIKLVPVNAPYFDGAKLLIAADCTAYAYADMHREFMKGKVTLIGCPKLDSVDYSEKLTQIIAQNDIKEVFILRMEVPCCGGLQNAAVTALKNSGKFIPWRVIVISIDGEIKE